MVRRKKSKSLVAEPKVEPPAPNVGTSLRDLLEQAGVSRPPSKPAGGGAAPAAQKAIKQPTKPAVAQPEPTAAEERQSAPVRRAPLSSGELAAWNEAYRDVAPLRAKRRRRSSGPAVVPATEGVESEAERAARARLSALVADGQRFQVEWDQEWVLGSREGADREKLARRLGGRGFTPEAQLDLHGQTRAEVSATVDRFVRLQRRSGRRFLLLIVGKGHHSEDGHGVLAEATVAALTRGGAAPLVAGFASAHPRHGGSGALAVALN